VISPPSSSTLPSNPAAAIRVADRIEAGVELLREFPIGKRGRATNTFERGLAGLPYIVTYRLAPRPEGGERLEILHVTHGARDWRAGEWPPE
jgi:plasmid stabilization system protein ParE